jgi:phospholipase C
MMQWIRIVLAVVIVAVAIFIADKWMHPSRVAAAAPSGGVALVGELRQRVKHVFVIYQENHSFDNYFGTFPGSDNLANPKARTHGFRQYDPMGKQWVTPFTITDPDIASPEHSRKALLAKMDGGKLDNYIAAQETERVQAGFTAANARRVGLLTMAHYDCNTLPFLWKYAHEFALYDEFFQAMTGPSTPGNIEILAAQTGQSQGARDPSEIARPFGKAPGEPVINDLEPPFGPFSEPPGKKRQLSQDYATVLLTLNGRDDRLATKDTDGVRKDLRFMTDSGRVAVPWGWYQEGYNYSNMAALRGYQSHRNVVQYFGYMRNNPVFWSHVHSLGEMLAALRNGTLPPQSVSYIKGGYYNHFGWRPANTDPFVQQHYLGDDDHPGSDDSDHQVAEAFVATFVNAIARSRYWKDSAIIIVWDDSGGFYDHAPSPEFERCPDGHACGDGPRVPLILISPYARAGVVHDVGDTSSVVKFVNTLFGLPPLATLPDEEPYLPEGPRDTNRRLTDLTGGFDPRRLTGESAPLPASTAEIPDDVVGRFPPPLSCKTIGVEPVAVPGALSSPPSGFAPRPSQYFP